MANLDIFHDFIDENDAGEEFTFRIFIQNTLLYTKPKNTRIYKLKKSTSNVSFS